MSAILNYYSGPYNFDNEGNIYIHLHSKNIGRAMKGSPVDPFSVTSLFRQQKEQALKASKFQFKVLFKNSLDEKSAKLLDQIFNNDDFMTKIQNEIGEKLSQALSIDKMQALMNIYNATPIDQIANSILSRSKDSIKDFDILLQNLSQAVKILGTESGARLAILLNHQHKINNSKQLGKFLLKALSTFEKQNQKILLTDLEIQQADQIISLIKPLATALSSNITSGGEPLTKRGINKMIENIFNTGFAESVSAMIKNTAYITLDQTFKAALSGNKMVQIQYTNEFGQAIASSFRKAAYGKADATFNNIKVKLEGVNNQINLDIGISDKFYKLNYFPGINANKNRNSYSSGSGGSLVEALQSSFGTKLRYIYYAYNILSHGDKEEWSQAQGALNEVLLTRQIVRLFASRGGNQDFAQFLFANGQIVPIWNIIMSTMNNISLSETQGGQSSQPVTLHIEGRKEIQKNAQKYQKSLEQRIYNANKSIQRAKIKAHVNLLKL